MIFNDSNFFAEAQRRIGRLIEEALSSLPEDRLKQAMLYSALNGGKRIRPLFCYATADIFGASPHLTDDAAVAIELIHAYSLIHDDLPAMDDDDLRRGKATCHLAFDEATAILAGDALQARAFDILSGDGLISADDTTRLAMVRHLASAAGASGMVLGQSIDICATNRRVDLEQLQTMHNKKTGALIDAAVYLGAISSQKADDRDLKTLRNYSSAIGLAFQVKDDILDVESSTEILGKRQGADATLNKATYTSMLGMEGAKAKLADLHQTALASLDHFGPKAVHLRHIADFIVKRDH